MDWLKENWMVLGMVISCASMHLLCLRGRKREKARIESPTDEKVPCKTMNKSGKKRFKSGCCS
jgi:hypothetical protein